MGRGRRATAAYKAAGYKPHDGNAATLRGNKRVKARIAELQERGAKAVEKTVADICRMLDEDRALAHKIEAAGAAVSASMGQAKVLGLIVEKREHTIKRVEDMTESEIDEMLGESSSNAGR